MYYNRYYFFISLLSPDTLKTLTVFIHCLNLIVTEVADPITYNVPCCTTVFSKVADTPELSMEGVLCFKQAL